VPQIEDLRADPFERASQAGPGDNPSPPAIP
jgi:hypothetical protein